MIATRFQDWELQIAGPDDGFRDSLIRIIEKNHVPRVSLVGELSGESKYEFLSSADLYIQPSYTENFGVTIAEAMSCGLPVIASRGTPWSGLESHKCGWWIDVGIQPLANALENAMTLGESDLKSMGKRSREWMIREFDWNAIGERMKRSYEWILSPNEVQCPEWIVTD